MKRHLERKYCILCLCLLTGVNASYAIDAKSNLPISIESDSALLDDSTGTSTYSGNVVISQGDSVVNADKIDVKAIDRKISSITAAGKPAHFLQSDAVLGKTEGYANIIVFSAQEAILSFEGDASLIQTHNSFSGEKIEYDIMKKAIRARGDENSGKRVKIQYFPNTDTELSADEKVYEAE